MNKSSFAYGCFEFCRLYVFSYFAELLIINIKLQSSMPKWCHIVFLRGVRISQLRWTVGHDLVWTEISQKLIYRLSVYRKKFPRVCESSIQMCKIALFKLVEIFMNKFKVEYFWSLMLTFFVCKDRFPFLEVWTQTFQSLGFNNFAKSNRQLLDSLISITWPACNKNSKNILFHYWTSAVLMPINWSQF